MKNMYQIRGDVRPAPVPDTRPSLKVGVASSSKWWLTLTLLCIVGLIGVRVARTALKATSTVRELSPSLSLPHTKEVSGRQEGSLAISVPATETEDLLRHLDSAIAAQKQAAAAVRRSQEWVNRALPSLEEGALDTKRLQLAVATATASETQINRAREEVQIIRNILIERSKQP